MNTRSKYLVKLLDVCWKILEFFGTRMLTLKMKVVDKMMELYHEGRE